MATKSAKLPEKLYVTAKKQPIYNNGNIIGHETPLGFLNAYEPGKASFEKKRLTQEEWAYREYIHNFVLEQRGLSNHPEYWITGYKYGPYDPSNPRGSQPMIAINRLADPQPAIWNNTPMRGFKIENSVSRYSTSNKLWRILDPRGVEFEISTGCLEQIIMDAGILKGGEIDGQCAWMSNKNLVFVP